MGEVFRRIEGGVVRAGGGMEEGEREGSLFALLDVTHESHHASANADQAKAKQGEVVKK